MTDPTLPDDVLMDPNRRGIREMNFAPVLQAYEALNRANWQYMAQRNAADFTFNTSYLMCMCDGAISFASALAVGGLLPDNDFMGGDWTPLPTAIWVLDSLTEQAGDREVIQEWVAERRGRIAAVLKQAGINEAFVRETATRVAGEQFEGG